VLPGEGPSEFDGKDAVEVLKECFQFLSVGPHGRYSEARCEVISVDEV